MEQGGYARAGEGDPDEDVESDEHGRVTAEMCTAVTFELDASTLAQLDTDERVRDAEPAFPTDNEEACVRWKLWELVGKHVEQFSRSTRPA